MSVYEQHCILTYVTEVMRLKPCLFHGERRFPREADNKLIRASQVKGNAFRKDKCAHRAQGPHPGGKALTSRGDVKELSFPDGSRVEHWHCSFRVTKAAAAEAESAGRKNAHLLPGQAGSFESHPGYCCCSRVM